MDKRTLSERDICTKLINPAREQAGWDIQSQVREELPVANGRIIIRGRMHTRAHSRRADYVLNYKRTSPSQLSKPKITKRHAASLGLQRCIGCTLCLQ
ncbi:type I restriction enzyme, R subunit [Vreelandella titanicae]|jgi:type I restriction enzyme R subunit|uniref:Uncharacterized protein n=1 Tax=Vreelandella titanicae TaxID=664683 RepID=A0AAP9NSX2_9GAMM|nr:hypothetical protein FX987_05070 [Halomonas titanicae]SDJ03200.1 type I restriction enzyme, R subunit [Halomonas titanicae]